MYLTAHSSILYIALRCAPQSQPSVSILRKRTPIKEFTLTDDELNPTLQTL